jgi:hypothetical protein
MKLTTYLHLVPRSVMVEIYLHSPIRIPRRLTMSWVSTACYRDNFTFLEVIWISHGGDYEDDYCLLWYTVMCLADIYGSFGGKCCAHLRGLRISHGRNQCGARSRKMEATSSSETSIDFQRTARSYIPEDRTRHNQRCENLKSHIMISGWTPTYKYYKLIQK